MSTEHSSMDTEHFIQIGTPATPPERAMATSVPARLTTPAATRPAGRMYMTSELRRATGLTRTHMDFYLRERLVLPTARTESGFLLFDDAELETLRTVIALRTAGVGLKDIRGRLGRDQVPSDE